MNVYVVIPSARDLAFLEAWENEFSSCHLLIVEDHKKPEIVIPPVPCLSIERVTWEDIKNDFGKDEWIFPRQNAGIRSYGFWKAYASGADVIITLDDDCFPVDRPFVEGHLSNLSFLSAKRWFATYPNPAYMYTRGFPYNLREKIPSMVSHGLWSGALDLDGKTEVSLGRLLSESTYPPIRQIIPKGYYFPMCSMNLAFRREVISLMYFPPMGYDPIGNHWGFDRFDDIWCGIFVKKICDHLEYGIVNGSPFIEHRKKSSPNKNIDKEKTGIIINEELWLSIDKVELETTNPISCFVELNQKVVFPKTNYFSRLKKAIEIWTRYFL